MIELDSADSVLARPNRDAYSANVEVKLVKFDQAVRVGFNIHLAIAHDFGCDPAGAQF